jgi:hypothetical protein
MRSSIVAFAAAALLAAGARAQVNAGSGSYGHSKDSHSDNSADSKVGGPTPGDAASGDNAEGRPRAGLENGTAAATQGGRTDTGAPVEHSPVARPEEGDSNGSNQNNTANRKRRQGETEDQEFNRIPAQGASMMTPEEQKEGMAAAKRRGKQRKDSIEPRSTEMKPENPEAATVPRTDEHRQ